MRKFLLYIALSLVALAMTALTSYATVPTGYYTGLTGKANGELKTALYNIIKNQTRASSSQTTNYTNLPSSFKKTDTYPGTTRYWDMYSNLEVSYAASGFKFGSYYNREHSFPKSWWGGADNIMAYSDINLLYPAEAAANQAKSNYPLAVVTGTHKFDNGVSVIGVSNNCGGAAYAFEPADEYKGDFARTYFYVVTCYQDLTWASKYMFMLQQNTYPTLQQWAIDLLLKWHRQDPVSQKELDRNDAVYTIQSNRNPFIDYPDLAEYIWGNKKGQAWPDQSSTPSGGNAVLITPPNKMTLDFGEVAVGYTQVAQLQFRGQDLTKALPIRISGLNASQFSIDGSVTSVAAAAINAEGGTWVTIKYTPTSVGTHQANIVITPTSDFSSDTEWRSGRTIPLRGQALAVPTLSKPTGLTATDVSSAGFTLTWDSITTETIDYYIVTLTKYMTDGTVQTEELPAEICSLTIDGMEGVKAASCTVQSLRLSIRSPKSDNIDVAIPASIDDIYVDDEQAPLVVESFDGFMRFRCSETHYGIRIYDVSGRLVCYLPQINDGDQLTLPLGLYLITSASHRTPVRAISR